MGCAAVTEECGQAQKLQMSFSLQFYPLFLSEKKARPWHRDISFVLQPSFHTPLEMPKGDHGQPS